jgi:ectoine hydroxylase-related dioxygenase (phytanoyl-CoA dioxygenase family)
MAEPTPFSEPYILTASQKESYAHDGYLLLTDLIPAELLQPLQTWTAEVQRLPSSEKGKWMHYEEVKREDGQRILCRTENFAAYHAGFDSLLRGTRVRGLLQQLSGEEMLLFKEKINYKRPGAGGFDAHTDAPAYQHSGVVKHLTINVAVDAATKENGCLEVVNGSHEMWVGGLTRQRKRKERESRGCPR